MHVDARAAAAVAAGFAEWGVDWLPTRLGVVDDSFLERRAVLYRADRTLANRFEAALQQQVLVGEEAMARGNARRGAVTPLMQAAARVLRQDQGPNIAAMEFSGWDTHANQGLAGGALDRLVGQLAEGLLAFRTDVVQLHMTLDSQRAYVRQWAETGRLLEDLRWRELAALDDRQAMASADALIEAALLVPLPSARRRWSGLAEQQALLHRSR